MILDFGDNTGSTLLLLLSVDKEEKDLHATSFVNSVALDLNESSLN